MKIHVITLLLACLFINGCDKPVELEAGHPAPAFTLYDLQGNLLRFPEDFTGKVVAIRFWADWCPYCQTEMDEIEAVYREYGPRGFVILALNVAQTKAQAQKFIDKLNISYPVLLDVDSQATKNYHVVGLPTTFFVNRSGILQNKLLGEAELQVFREMVNTIL